MFYLVFPFFPHPNLFFLFFQSLLGSHLEKDQKTFFSPNIARIIVYPKTPSPYAAILADIMNHMSHNESLMMSHISNTDWTR